VYSCAKRFAVAKQLCMRNTCDAVTRVFARHQAKCNLVWSIDACSVVARGNKPRAWLKVTAS